MPIMALAESPVINDYEVALAGNAVIDDALENEGVEEAPKDIATFDSQDELDELGNWVNCQGLL